LAMSLLFPKKPDPDENEHDIDLRARSSSKVTTVSQPSLHQLPFKVKKMLRKTHLTPTLVRSLTLVFNPLLVSLSLHLL
jgi:hypothetical protein